MSAFWMKGEDVLVKRHNRRHLGKLVYYVQPGIETENIKTQTIKQYVLLGKEIKSSMDLARYYQGYEESDEEETFIVHTNVNNRRKKASRKNPVRRAKDYVSRHIFHHENSKTLTEIDNVDEIDIYQFRKLNLSPRSADITCGESPRSRESPRSQQSTKSTKFGSVKYMPMIDPNKMPSQSGNSEIDVACDKTTVITQATENTDSRSLPDIPIIPLKDENLKRLNQPTYDSINETIINWLDELSDVVPGISNEQEDRT